jgi:hypothetical protein
MRLFDRITLLPAAVFVCAVTVAAPPNARAYLRAVTSQTPNANSTCEGQLLDVYWDTRSHQWWLFRDPAHPNTVAGLDWSGVETAMQAAAQTWQEVQCSDTTFQYMGSTTQYQIGYDPTSSANQNIEVFRELSCSDTTVVPANDPCHGTDNCGDTYNCWGHENDIIALTRTRSSMPRRIPAMACPTTISPICPVRRAERLRPPAVSLPVRTPRIRRR